MPYFLLTHFRSADFVSFLSMLLHSFRSGHCFMLHDYCIGSQTLSASLIYYMVRLVDD